MTNDQWPKELKIIKNKKRKTKVASWVLVHNSQYKLKNKRECRTLHHLVFCLPITFKDLQKKSTFSLSASDSVTLKSRRSHSIPFLSIYLPFQLQSTTPGRTEAAMAFQKIKVANPIVEMDGEISLPSLCILYFLRSVCFRCRLSELIDLLILFRFVLVLVVNFLSWIFYVPKMFICLSSAKVVTFIFVILCFPFSIPSKVGRTKTLLFLGYRKKTHLPEMICFSPKTSLTCYFDL